MKLNETVLFERQGRTKPVDPEIRRIVERDIDNTMDAGTAGNLQEKWDEMHIAMGKRAGELNLFKARDVIKMISIVTSHPMSDLSQRDLLQMEIDDDSNFTDASLMSMLDKLYYEMKNLSASGEYKEPSGSISKRLEGRVIEDYGTVGFGATVELRKVYGRAELHIYSEAKKKYMILEALMGNTLHITNPLTRESKLIRVKDVERNFGFKAGEFNDLIKKLANSSNEEANELARLIRKKRNT